MKPFSESCEQNKQPILEVLQQHLASARRVLEIGSGTGQHAVFFAAQLPHLHWLASDVPANHPGIDAWIGEAGLANLSGPLALDVNQPDWPVVDCDAVFSANSAHIMDWPSVQNMFAGIGRVLETGGVFCLYGPFNYEGRYTSDSNARFDAWLKARDPASGIRDFETLAALAEDAGLTFIADHAMPANNRILVWRKPG
ncbi:MAG: class I SAM-dependent methyltransferase [Proteobacteria bacterium]|jgi:SAM-dependent methyltransferase|nr:class I SAM-dependent methyltransferase [Pseudomonadota bacterium]